ncbi:MAG TPA: polymer-forming cytoskeletal protein [Anaerolineaceae bacterium]|nr:polymer-forming cytoskeletal protein [Anaerolineaceae bacterium]
MFGKKKSDPVFSIEPVANQVTTILGQGINWTGDLRGKGGVRIEGTMEGEIAMRGLVVIGETGKVTCKNLSADTVMVAGMVKGNITCQKLEIRATGRIWGDVVTSSFASEDGAFFRGQMRMEEQINLPPAEDVPSSDRNMPDDKSISATELTLEKPTAGTQEPTNSI